MRGARWASLDAANASRPHGTRQRYNSGCRCFSCRVASSAYDRARYRARRNGEWNGTVSAERARNHLAHLSSKGVGYCSVAAASDVSETLLYYIASGRRTHIRAQTERRILAVDEGAGLAGTLLPAAPTWKLLDELIERGFSRAQLAEWLGYKRSLHIHRGRITAKTAARVRHMYELLNAGKLRRTR